MSKTKIIDYFKPVVDSPKNDVDGARGVAKSSQEGCNKHLQIIQVLPFENAAWVVWDGNMVKVPIIVDSEVKKRLQFNQKKRLELNQMEFNTIVTFGCVCEIDESLNVKDGLFLNNMHMKEMKECFYLPPPISFFYLYHSVSEQKGFYLVYFPARSTVRVVVVDPDKNEDITPDSLQNQFSKVMPDHSIRRQVVDYTDNFEEAGKMIQKTIDEIRSQHAGPPIAVIECPDVCLMKSRIPALGGFPCVNIPSYVGDCQYQALGWQVVAAKIGIDRCAASSSRLNEKVSLSRFAQVPVGNIGPDWPIQTIDILFERALRLKIQKSLVSDNGTSNHGGDYEVDEPYVTHAAVCQDVTAEVKIQNLAANALLLGAYHGLTSSLHLPKPEDHQWLPTIHVLQEVVKGWVGQGESPGFAVKLLQHLYRWLCCPRSKLHDPALLQVLQKVMRMVLNVMLEEFESFGAKIIFANYSKVIIDTGIPDRSCAQTYCNGLLRGLHERQPQLFKWIKLEPTHFWDSLLFMDEYNYGGVEAKSDEVCYQPLWSIAENLPEKAQFCSIISDFVHLSWKFKQGADVRNASIKQSLKQHLMEKIAFDLLSPKLVSIVEEVNFNALELVKRVCAVLELDPNLLTGGYWIIKSKLFRTMDVGEYSSMAQFQNYTFAFTLPSVFCSHCSYYRDIDFREDSCLSSQRWSCSGPQCGEPYDPNMMQNELCRIMQQIERDYQLQPLVCLNCPGSKAKFSKHCSGCGGAFTLKQNAFTDHKGKLQVLLKIAEHQKFELLRECVSWLIAS